ncbi:MAG: hypothetical protein IJX59_04900 [Clostridia bacterium]|nr:hypothetical protein [Clostridia bacterium]
MERNTQITVEKLWELLKKNLLWIVLAGVVLGCITGVCGQLGIQDEYTSKMNIILDTKDASGTDVGNLEYHTGRTVTYLNSPSTVKRAVELAGIRVNGELEPAVQVMMGGVHISGNGDTGSITIAVTSTSGGASFQMVRAYEELLPEIIEQEGLMPIDVLDMPDKAPTAPSNGGRALKYGILGGALGVLLAYVFFVLRSFFDVIIRSENDLKEALDLPILGQIPFYAPGSDENAGMRK